MSSIKRRNCETTRNDSPTSTREVERSEAPFSSKEIPSAASPALCRYRYLSPAIVAISPRTSVPFPGRENLANSRVKENQTHVCNCAATPKDCISSNSVINNNLHGYLFFSPSLSLSRDHEDQGSASPTEAISARAISREMVPGAQRNNAGKTALKEEKDRSNGTNP